MTATVKSGLAPLSEVDLDVTVDPVREYMRKMANGGNDELASEVDLELPIEPQRGFMIGNVRL
jgi:hypothetical protein